MSALLGRRCWWLAFACLRVPGVTNRTLNNSTIAEILRLGAGTDVTVKGWVKAVRRHKGVCFLNVTDGLSAGHIQLVVPSSELPQTVNAGASIVARGTLTQSVGPSQPVELHASVINVLGECSSEEFPFLARTQHPPDYVRKYLHLRPKISTFASLLRVRSEVWTAVSKYFSERHYVKIDAPVLTASDCEGGGEIFAVSQNDAKKKKEAYFKHPVFLTVSGQLHLEVACGGLSRVYSLGPTFRADNAIDRTHLSEFYMLEAELAFTESLADLLEVMEDFLKNLCGYLLNSCVSDDISYFHNTSPDVKDAIEKMVKLQVFPRMTYSDAITLLNQNQEKFKNSRPLKWGNDLHREHEKFLVSAVGNVPLFVTDWPSSLKPFYMRPNDGDDGATVSCADLLVPGPGELCGGSLREERYNRLAAALEQKGVTGDYSWYLDLRKFGSAPHGGFGMGFERFLQYFLGIAQIRDTIPYPRYVGSCKM